MKEMQQLILAAMDRDWNMVRELVPELEPLWSIPQGTITAGAHTEAVVKAVPEGDITMVLVALFHDIGKEATKQPKGEGFYSFHGHESVGSEITKKVLLDLRCPEDLANRVSELVALHMWPLNTIPEQVSDKAIRRLLRRLGGDIELLFRHAEIDLQCMDVSARRNRELERLPKLRERVQQVIEKEAAKTVSPAPTVSAPLS